MTKAKSLPRDPNWGETKYGTRFDFTMSEYLFQLSAFIFHPFS